MEKKIKVENEKSVFVKKKKRLKDTKRPQKARKSASKAMTADNLERVETAATVSTILQPDGGELAVLPHKRFRSFGNPAAVGLATFAGSVFVLGFTQIQPDSLYIPNIYVGIAFFYGGLTGTITGNWEFAVGNTFGGTALISFGGFWMSLAAVYIPGFNIVNSYLTDPLMLYHAVGVFLAGWTIFAFIVWAATLGSTLGLALMFTFIFVSFLLGCLCYFDNQNFGLNRASGICSIIAAVLGWYNVLEGLLTKDNSWFTIRPVLLPQPGLKPGQPRLS